MEYRNLGRTGVKVSPLCLGTMNFNGGAQNGTTEDEAKQMINHALDVGVNFIDTADAYSGGVSEEIIGRTLKENGKRDFVVLATKVFSPMSDDPNDGGSSRRHIVKACEDSLRRLQTDTIDLYQLHGPSKDVPIDETLRALDDLIRAGKVRYIGCSNFEAWQIVEALYTSEIHGLHRFVSEQPPYSMIFRQGERRVFPVADKYDLAILPWSPLWGGFLTGKYKRGEAPPEGTRFSRTNVWNKRTDERVYDLLDVLGKMAEEKGCTISQMALAWTMAQPHVTSPVIGPRTMTQLEDNLGAFDVEVTQDDMDKIDAIIAPKEEFVYWSLDG